jgi:hypothetical protein
MAEEGANTILTDGSSTDDTGAPAGGEETPQQSFLDTIPENIRTHESLSSIENAGQLAEKYVETLGKVPVVPEKPEDYRIDAPEGMQLDTERVNAFKSFAHQIGLTQDQVASIVQHEAEQGRKASEAAEKAREEQIETLREKHETQLREEWKTEFDSNLEVARKAVTTFGDKEFAEWLEATRLGDHPKFIKLMHGIGKRISEHSFVDGKGGGAPPPRLQRTLQGSPHLQFPNTPSMRDK